MAILSVSEYVKNKNIRQSLSSKKGSEGWLYFYQGVWITETYLNELLPIELPYPENSKKGANAEVKRRFIHNERSY